MGPQPSERNPTYVTNTIYCSSRYRCVCGALRAGENGLTSEINIVDDGAPAHVHTQKHRLTNVYPSAIYAWWTICRWDWFLLNGEVAHTVHKAVSSTASGALQAFTNALLCGNRLHQKQRTLVMCIQSYGCDNVMGVSCRGGRRRRVWRHVAPCCKNASRKTAISALHEFAQSPFGIC